MLVLSFVLLLSTTGLLAAPAKVRKQRVLVPKFKNFPVVGLKETVDIEPVFDTEIVEEHPRDTRQTDGYSEDFASADNLDDVFVEEAVYLTPEDREQRALEEQQTQDDSWNVFDDESLDNNESVRPERDGAHGHHGSSGHHAQRGGRAGGHRAAPAPVAINEYDYEYDDEYDVPARQEPQQQRRGKQTGGTGVALGVLSSPPGSDGNYNFK